jgi:hypothetical protein
MSVLQFGPKSFFQPRVYSIEREGAPVGEIACAKRWESAAITIGATNYAAAREGRMSGPFYLEANGNRVADAEQSRAWKRLFTVRVGARTLTLKTASLFARGFILTERDVPIGSIAPAGWFGRKSRAELPDDMAPEIQAFLIWLVIVMRRRALIQTLVIADLTAGT